MILYKKHQNGTKTTRADLENQYVDVVKSRNEVDEGKWFVNPERVTLQPGQFQKPVPVGPPAENYTPPTPPTLGPVDYWKPKPLPKMFNR